MLFLAAQLQSASQPSAKVVRHYVSLGLWLLGLEEVVGGG